MSAVLDGIQSALRPQGPDASLTAEIAWVLFAGGALIFVAVAALTAYALLARRDRAAALAGRGFVVGGGIVFPTVTLTALLAYTLWRSASLASVGDDAALRVEVTGEQWWWRVHYLDAAGGVDFATANEVHVPAGRPVDLVLRSADVIHSFWVPSLAGKLDMIPGRVNRLRITASAPGRYRGQCAEYCGGPHGQMAFFVVAHTPESFAAWAARQRAPAPAAASPGRELFEARCGACHAIRGTAAAGTRGPDLTHFASRDSIGAAWLPMSEGNVAAWIARNQKIKPGNLMPEFGHLPPQELRALSAYVAHLH